MNMYRLFYGAILSCALLSHASEFKSVYAYPEVTFPPELVGASLIHTEKGFCIVASSKMRLLDEVEWKVSQMSHSQLQSFFEVGRLIVKRKTGERGEARYLLTSQRGTQD